MNLKKMMIGSALLMAACCMQAQTKAIAHRGFWKTPGSSQNSITSLLKADSIGCYGSEFDVWLTKLLQKSEMRKNMVMDLIYRGFIYAANYSESHYNPRRSQIKTELRYLFVTTPNR